MPERKTLISRSTEAPKVQLSNKQIPGGAFGDYTGLMHLGQGLSAVSDTAFAFAQQNNRRQARLQEEQQRREDHDADLVLENKVREISGQVNKLIAEQSPGWEASEIFSRTSEILATNRTAFDQALAEMNQKVPGMGRVATKDRVDNYWLRMSGPLLEQAAGQQAERTQKVREVNTTQAVIGRINDAGTDLDRLLSAATEAEDLVTSQNKGLYSEGYRLSLRPNVIGPAVTSSLQAAVIQAGGWTPSIRAAADQAHGRGWLSTENHALLMRKAAEAQSITQAELAERTRQNLDALSSGRLTADENVISGVVAQSGKTGQPAQEKEIRDKAILAAAQGTLARRAQEGSFVFPFAQEDAASGPTIFQAQQILAGNDVSAIRRVIASALADLPGAQDAVAGMTESDVRGAASEMLKQVNDQLSLPVNRVAQHSPAIRAIDAGNPENVPALLQAYEGWYEANKIPAEKRLLVHQPHIETLRQVFKEGDLNKFREYAVGLSAAYGKNAAHSFSKALAADKESEPYAGALRVIAQANMSGNERVQRGIQEFGETLLEAAFFDPQSVLQAHPEAKKHVEDLLASAGHMEDVNPLEMSPIGYAMHRLGGSGDQTVRNILTTLGDDGQHMPASMHRLLMNTVLKKAYGSGGQSTLNPGFEAQSVANGLSRAFMVVRTGGAFADQPSFILMTPDAQRQGKIDNWLFGTDANQAVSVDEDAEFMTQAIDAVMLNGLENANYTGAAPWLSKLDNFLGASAAKHVGYSINGFENRDASMWIPYAKQPHATVPGTLKIDWEKLTMPDGRPVASNSPRYNETFDLRAQREFDEKVRHSAPADRATLNQQAVGKNGYFVQLPSGDLQLFMRPASSRVENIGPATRGQGAPVLRDGKPVILSIKAIKAFRDNYLVHRLDVAQNGISR